VDPSINVEYKNDIILDVKRAKNGDKDAFCNLIRLNKVALYRVSKSILSREDDVEDAVSEAILKAYKNIKGLKDETLFKTWLIRIVINESNNIHKKRKREVVVENQQFFNIQVNDSYKDLSLYDAINSLDEDLKVITMLFYFEDIKYKDIAKILNIREGTVKSRLSRAKEKLYHMLKEELHG
jgi:RNA polymerase sigma-70 factor (ECF subfamily)